MVGTDPRQPSGVGIPGGCRIFAGYRVPRASRATATTSTRTIPPRRHPCRQLVLEKVLQNARVRLAERSSRGSPVAAVGS